MMAIIYIRLFIIVPLLIYTGYCIIKKHTHTSTIMFHTVVILLIALTLFFHLTYLIKIVRRIFNNEQYQKEFGIFLLFLAVFITILCVNELYFQNETIRKSRKMIRFAGFTKDLA